MKKYTWIWVDIVICIILLISLFISYIMDNNRIMCMAFACVAILSLFAAIITYILELKNGRHPPIAFLVSLLILLCMEYNFSYSHTATPLKLDVILIIVIISVVMSVVTAIVAYFKKTLKNIVVAFCINIIAYLFVGFLSIFFINYAFDASIPQNETFIITELVDDYAGRGDKTYTYSVKYIGDNKDVCMDKIELDYRYVFEEGDCIIVKFRKGLFYSIYKIDYSKAKLRDDIIFSLSKK